MSDCLDFEILYKEMLVAHVVYNRETRKLVVDQFTDHVFYRQFKQKEITMKHIAIWMENRCFPKERVNKDKLLADLGGKRVLSFINYSENSRIANGRLLLGTVQG